MTEPLSITELNAGDSSRASHVWRVDFPDHSEIYRRSWWITPEVSAFMLGLSRLFGVDPRDLQATAQTYFFWRDLRVWKVPDVLGFTDFQGGPALRLEFIEGTSREFGDLNATELGRSIAQLHGHQAAFFGDVNGQNQFPLTDFYSRALEVIWEVAPKYQARNWEAHWAEVEDIFKQTPAPAFAVPLLLDWNGTQFIWQGGQPFALVDVEASALAPPELDLTFWEILLTPTQAQQFKKGYEQIRPMPDLTPYRAACRPILLALESEGSPPLHAFLNAPSLFRT